jgi:molecular chaperone DnaK (HSP70)
VLTTHVAFGPSQCALLEQAAIAAGFTQVKLIDDAVAAARGWLAHSGEPERPIIVLDCGGGTVRWAYVNNQRTEFSGGADDLAVQEVDRAIQKRLLQHWETAYGEALDLDSPSQVHLLVHARYIKEAVSRGSEPPSFKIDGVLIHLASEEVREIAAGSFVTRIAAHFSSFLRELHENFQLESSPLVLLVGGSSQLIGLRKTIQGLDCTLIAWDRAVFGPVLGAILDISGADAMNQGVAAEKQGSFAEAVRGFRKAAEMATPTHRIASACSI